MKIAAVFVGIALVLGVLYLYLSQEVRNNEFPTSEEGSEVDFIKERDKSVQEFSEEYKQNNPESELNVEAILKQTSNLALITSALKAYARQNGGRYPETLSELSPEYTSPQMFPDGKIPLDHDGIPFNYDASEDRLSYTLCHQDLENGGTDCVGSTQ